MILTRNDDYWGEKAKIQNLIFRTMPEASARVVALNNGEVDVITGLDTNVVAEIQNAGNQIFMEEGINTNFMIFNCRENTSTIPVNSRVRRAIAAAINKEELVNTLYKEYSVPAHTILPKAIPGYSDDIKTVEYDPQFAKAELEELGIDHLIIMTYSGARAYNSVGGQVLAEAVQSYLAKVGVQADVIVYDWTTFKNKLTTNEFDICFIGWTGDNGDADNFLRLFAVDDPISNQGMWNNKEYRDIVNEAVAVPDGDERDALYKKAEQINADAAAIYPLSHAKSMAAYRSNIKNFRLHPTGIAFLDKVEKE